MITATDNHTIIAQCTPKGAGALALLRLSGDDAFSLATTMSVLASSGTLEQQSSHTIHYGTVIDADGSGIDNVLFLLMRAPRTFTGQDTVEITCHNNQFVIERIVQRALQLGARLAGHGEFSKRAFLHGKIDLLQAEAINELIGASNAQTLKQSLAQLQGSFSQWIVSVEQSLTRCFALSEASFEFLDDEMEFGTQINTEIEKITSTITMLKKTFDQQQQIRNGVRIAFIGSVNAGKSSLFNALLQQHRSIVTTIAGTTRDVVEAGLYRNGMYWTLVDTAGLRQTNDVIEQEGIRRSYEEIEKADIVVLIIDRARLMSTAEETIYHNIIITHAQKVIAVANKADLPVLCQSDVMALVALHASTTTDYGMQHLEKMLHEKVDSLFARAESPFLLNQRHYHLLLGLEKKLEAIHLLCQQQPLAYEIISYHLKDALENVTELTGKTISEQTMNMIFQEFCVGK